MRDYILLTINKQRYEIRGGDAFMMLADYLRKKAGLCGTKIVCAEGDCGACTVLYHPKLESNAGFMPVNACIIFVAQLDGGHILTVEGLKEDNKLSLVQEAVAKSHGAQCGYCTPGFVMAITAMIQKAKEPLLEQSIKNHLTGNLCRCTGYQTLIKAAQEIKLDNYKILTKPISLENKSSQVCVTNYSQVFFAPTDLVQAARWLKDNPGALILGSATDVGVSVNKNKLNIKYILSLQNIPELYTLEHKDQTIKIGARVSLSELRRFCKKLVPELARFLNIFASPQIKNMATLVGNVANGSPIADMPAFLMISDAKLSILSHAGSRQLNINELYTDYKKLSLDPDELITHIIFTIPASSHFLRLYKISQRRDLDIATLNAAFCCDLNTSHNKIFIKEARLALGGIAKSVIRMRETENVLKNKELNIKLIEEVLDAIQHEITPISDLRGSASFRRVLVDNLVRRYFQEIYGEPNCLK